MTRGLSLACRWVDARLDQFRLRREPEVLLATLKAVAELAHAADYLSRGGDRARGRRWLAHAWAEIEEGDVIRALVEADARYAPAAIAFLPFHVTGHRCPALYAVLERQVKRLRPSALEWTMTAPALAALGIGARPEQTPGAWRPPGHVDGAYLLAHQCLYDSDWGRRPPRTVDTDARIVAELTRAVAAGDADLAAELVLARHAHSGQCVDDDAWALLDAAQSSDGNVVPLPHIDTRVPRARHPTLSRTYHTTLAAIMAWSGCAHRS